jgi:hypothetical protein
MVNKDQAWVREWVAKKSEGAGKTYAPFQLYPRLLRAAQGYLTKMPAEFVSRWPQLEGLGTALSGVEDKLTPLAEHFPASSPERTPTIREEFRPKNADEYVAVIRASVQPRSRHHEHLVRQVGEYLQSRGVAVITPHPIDLLMTSPTVVIFEAKIVGKQPGLAIREAVGQLLEYRWFLGPREAGLCILLDGHPGVALVEYVEEQLGLLVAWWTGGTLDAGPRSRLRLAIS